MVGRRIPARGQDRRAARRRPPSRRPAAPHAEDRTLSRILFLTSNGAGLGHLTRSVAIGRRLDHDLGLLVFTLSQAAPMIAQQGVAVEYLFSRGYGNVGNPEWDRLYHDRIEAVLAEERPTVASFDGTFPYRGLTHSIEAHPEITWVWTRRAMWRAGTRELALERGRVFDAVIEPGEYAAERDPGPTVRLRGQAEVVAPIVYTDRDEVLERDIACDRLGIEPDGTNVLVQLGAGNINDIASTAGRVVRHLLDVGATVVVPISPIAASRPPLPEDVRTVSAYPLAPLFGAFDASVAAAGYNSFHELLQHGVPTLFLPNRETAVDDQVCRAEWASDRGVALIADEREPPSLVAGVEALADPGVRARLRTAMARLPLDNGAEEAAGLFRRWARQEASP